MDHIFQRRASLGAAVIICYNLIDSDHRWSDVELLGGVSTANRHVQGEVICIFDIRWYRLWLEMSWNVLISLVLSAALGLDLPKHPKPQLPATDQPPAHLVDVRTLRTCSRFDYIHHADQGWCGNHEVPSLSQTHCDFFCIYIHIIIIIYIHIHIHMRLWSISTVAFPAISLLA